MGGEVGVRFNIEPRGKVEGRLDEPGGAGPHDRIIRDGAHAQKKIVRKRLPGGHDSMIAEESGVAEPGHGEGDPAAMNARPSSGRSARPW